MGLVKQLEDKKKEMIEIENAMEHFREKSPIQYDIWFNKFKIVVKEIAILEQAIAEIKKQRQEEIEYWKRFENLLICSNEFNICKESVAKMKEWDFYKKRIKQLQSQQNGKGDDALRQQTTSELSEGTKASIPSYKSATCKPETQSADISNLLQKQRQEDFKKLVSKLKSCDEFFNVRGYEDTVSTDKFMGIVQLFIHQIEQEQLNQPKTEE